jgi:hypothetical protein
MVGDTTRVPTVLPPALKLVPVHEVALATFQARVALAPDAIWVGETVKVMSGEPG